MAQAGYELRPYTESFAHGGCRVSLVDIDGILAEAATRRVDLLHGAAFRTPVDDVRFSVGPGGLLEARIHEDTTTRPGPAVLGGDPLGLLLARRVRAGDPWAVRIVDGMETATAAAGRLLGLDRPPGRPGQGHPDPVSHEVTAGRLRATVRRADHTVTVRATAPGGGGLSAADVRAMFALVLDLTGAPAGGTCTLSRFPPGDADIDVTLDKVGGLPDVVAQFRQIAVSFRHPDVMARWGARRPQGILMYGPPGTGKTMLARALANEIGANFREIRTPEILDKWLGASERNIKRIFRDARRYRTATVMLFDEFDSIIAYAGAGGDAASQAVNAVAGIFKQEMNSLIEANPNVIVVATTNFPHRVDESLIRSGRFDIKLAIPKPDETGRADIIAKMIRELIARHEDDGFRMFADDVDAVELARATPGMTGADIKEVLRRVQLTKAMQEARTGVRATPISLADLRASAAELR